MLQNKISVKHRQDVPLISHVLCTYYPQYPPPLLVYYSVAALDVRPLRGSHIHLSGRI